MQYNVLIVKPWIDEIKFISYTLHQSVICIHEGNTCSIKVDPKSFQYCNVIQSHYDIMLSSTYIIPLNSSPTSSKILTSSSTSSQPTENITCQPTIINPYQTNIITSSKKFHHLIRLLLLLKQMGYLLSIIQILM